MKITIVDHGLNSETHKLYDVNMGLFTTVRTLVTNSGAMVESWIDETKRIHQRRPRNLIVGLDVQWQPSKRNSKNPPATLQLCVGRRCLVFQLIHADSIPSSLTEFLRNPDYTFVGIGIGADVEKLMLNKSLSVQNAVDLGDLAALEYDDRSLKNLELKELARSVLGMEIEKPRSITTGRWDNLLLTSDQVQDACVGAYASFEIGKKLITGAKNGVLFRLVLFCFVSFRFFAKVLLRLLWFCYVLFRFFAKVLFRFVLLHFVFLLKFCFVLFCLILFCFVLFCFLFFSLRV